MTTTGPPHLNGRTSTSVRARWRSGWMLLAVAVALGVLAAACSNDPAPSTLDATEGDPIEHAAEDCPEIEAPEAPTTTTEATTSEPTTPEPTTAEVDAALPTLATPPGADPDPTEQVDASPAVASTDTTDPTQGTVDEAGGSDEAGEGDLPDGNGPTTTAPLRPGDQVTEPRVECICGVAVPVSTPVDVPETTTTWLDDPTSTTTALEAGVDFDVNLTVPADPFPSGTEPNAPTVPVDPNRNTESTTTQTSETTTSDVPSPAPQSDADSTTTTTICPPDTTTTSTTELDPDADHPDTTAPSDDEQYVPTPEPLGTPTGFGAGRNYLGTNNLLPAGPTRDDFWLSVSGYCARREHGDRITPAAAANHGTGGGFKDCAGPAGATITNPEFDPDGYFYAVVLDDRAGGHGPWGDDVHIEIFDAPHCQGRGSSFDSGAIPNAQRHYRFRVRSNDSADPRTASVLHDRVITPDDCRTMASIWLTLHTLAAPTQGTYWVQITPVVPDDTTMPEGQNQFGIRARNASVGTANDQWPCAADPAAAAERLPTLLREDGSNGCPEVAAHDHMGTYLRLAGLRIDFPMLPVGSEHAGRTLDIELFDPAEGAAGIEILDPTRRPVAFTWEIACYDGRYLSETGGSCPPIDDRREVEPPSPGRGPLEDTFLDTSGESNAYSPWGRGNSQNQRFNDRVVRLRVQLPTLEQNPSWYDGNTRFSVRYHTGSTSGDRTTWIARIHG